MFLQLQNKFTALIESILYVLVETRALYLGNSNSCFDDQNTCSFKSD